MQPDTEFIPQMQPWFDEAETAALVDYMKSGGWLTEFSQTLQFEQSIAEFTGARHCVVTNNGTISLTLAALACGLKAGDEVIVPNYTMIATPNAVQMMGAVPVFVDVELDTLCLDMSQAECALTPRTRAIVLVSPNGRYPRAGVATVEEFCARNGLLLIEDAAQSLGSYFPDGRHVGRAGKVGSFSFSMPKIITTGQGGALITDDDDVARKLRLLKDFGRAAGGTDIHHSIGYNFKFTDLQAVLGLAQMKKLPGRVMRKKEIYQAYRTGLADLPTVRLFEHDLRFTCPWFVDVLVDGRDELSRFLRENGIGTRVMYPPINKQLAYAQSAHCPVSELIGKSGLWLPSFGQLKDHEIVRICQRIREWEAR